MRPIRRNSSIMNRYFRSRRRHNPGQMNGLETRFSEYLENLKKKGEILWWRYEGIRLKLTEAEGTTHYTPDFCVFDRDGGMTFYETKGRWLSSARVKIKVAADQFYMFKFVGAMAKTKKQGGGWKFEEFGGKNEE